MCFVNAWKMTKYELSKFDLILGYSSYSPSTLPSTIAVHPQFGLGMDFILDGNIDPEVERISFPVVVFASQAGNVSLSLEIDPVSSVLNLRNDFDVSFDKLARL